MIMMMMMMTAYINLIEMSLAYVMNSIEHTTRNYEEFKVCRPVQRAD